MVLRVQGTLSVGNTTLAVGTTTLAGENNSGKIHTA